MASVLSQTVFCNQTAKRTAGRNTGAALYIAGKIYTIEESVRLSESLIDDGSALRKLEEFIRESNI